MIMRVKTRKWRSLESVTSLFRRYVRNPINSLGDGHEPAIGVNYDAHGDVQSVEAVGFSAADLRILKSLISFDPLFKKVFGIYSVSAAGGEEQPTLIRGKYHIEQGRIIFRPRFALLPGVKYRAIAHFDSLTGEEVELGSYQVEREFEVASSPD